MHIFYSSWHCCCFYCNCSQGCCSSYHCTFWIAYIGIRTGELLAFALRGSRSRSEGSMCYRRKFAHKELQERSRPRFPGLGCEEMHCYGQCCQFPRLNLISPVICQQNVGSPGHGTKRMYFVHFCAHVWLQRKKSALDSFFFSFLHPKTI